MSEFVCYIFRKLERLSLSCSPYYCASNGVSLQLGSHHCHQVHCCQVAFQGELNPHSYKVYCVCCICLDLGHCYQCMHIFSK